MRIAIVNNDSNGNNDTNNNNEVSKKYNEE